MRRAALLTCAAGAGLAAATGTAVAQKPPRGDSSVTIAASPTTVTFGKATTISGRAAGRDAAGAEITLQGDIFPFEGDFRRFREVVAGATGTYSFTNVRPGRNTRYRVTARTKPRATSTVAPVNVRPVISRRVSDRTPAKGQRVRFRGTVTPAHNGRRVSIQRRLLAGWKTVARPMLVAATPRNGVPRSKYSRRLRIRRTGTYRVRIHAHGDHAGNTTRRVRLEVH